MKLNKIGLCLGAILATLFGCGNFAIFQTYNPQPAAAVVCNVITGVATGVGAGTCATIPAVCNGSNDDSAAFATINDWAVNTWQASHSGLIEIFIPSGSTCNFVDVSVCPNLACPFRNILKVRVSGYGATTTGLAFFAGITMPNDASNSARTNSASSGDSCVTVKIATATNITGIADNGSGLSRLAVTSSAAYSVGQWLFISGVVGADYINGNRRITSIVDGTHLDVETSFDAARPYTSGGAVTNPTSMFIAGRYALMSGYDIQGLYLASYGYPPNPHYFEYLKISSVNTGTGEVCFETSLQNSYLDTWPNYNSGTRFEVDNGGPATLYALLSDYDTEVEIDGLIIDGTGITQIAARGRLAVYRNVTFVDSYIVPSLNKYIACIGCVVTQTIEMDKLVSELVLENSTLHSIDFQSSSIGLITASNTTLSSFWNGTPRIANLINVTIAGAFSPGAFAYGRSEEIVCTNCSFGSVTLPGGLLEKGAADVGVNVDYSMSSGVISVPIVNGAVRWAVPGTNLMWNGSLSSETLFRSVSVTQNGTHTLVQTNLVGGFPNVPLQGGTKLFIVTHPSPKFTCTNCTVGGVAFAPSAPSAPIYTLASTASTTGAAPAARTIWGTFTSFIVDVTQAYTGTEVTLTLSAGGQFGAATIKPSDDSLFAYNPVINLKQKGRRVITPSAVTCDGSPGACSGDTGLTMTEAYWAAQSIGPFVNADVVAECAGTPAACFNVTIEVQTNQGVVLP